VNNNPSVIDVDFINLMILTLTGKHVSFNLLEIMIYRLKHLLGLGKLLLAFEEKF